MRILHTADWHLGKQLHGVSLLEDQAHVLDQIVEIARKEQPDAIVVAGDVYDRQIPPPDAVTLLDQTFSRLLAEADAPLLVIPGNHDGRERLAAFSSLLAPSGLHLTGRFEGTIPTIELADPFGPVHFHLLCYLYPAEVKTVLGDDKISGHQQATAAALATLAPQIEKAPKGTRHVLVAHAFVDGGTESESERPLAVGSAGTVEPGLFDPFDYVALGHLHEPQEMGHAAMRYSGSPLKYSFSEAEHEKSVSLVDIGPAGTRGVTLVPLTPKRDLRIVEGKFQELLEAGLEGNQPGQEDYLLARITDQQLVLDPMGRLREVYPNLLQIEAPHLDVDPADHDQLTPDVLREQDELSVFRSFFEHVTGEQVSEAQAEKFAEIVEGLNGENG